MYFRPLYTLNQTTYLSNVANVPRMLMHSNNINAFEQLQHYLSLELSQKRVIGEATCSI